MKLKLILGLSVVFFLSMATSCRKNFYHPVPSLPFDVTININMPTYINLTGVGGSAFINNVGSKGVIVYRRNVQEFVAFDLHSPAQEGACTTPLIVNANNTLELLDTCHQASFSLYDGAPISGSDLGLRMYTTMFDGLSNLRVYN